MQAKKKIPELKVITGNPAPVKPMLSSTEKAFLDMLAISFMNGIKKQCKPVTAGCGKI